jgi:hypothetical protein
MAGLAPQGQTEVTVEGTTTVTMVGAIPGGTNTIGSVDIASSIPAGSNLIGSVDIANTPSVAISSPSLVPVNKATIFNTAVSAATNILATALSPTNTPTRFRIYAAFSAAGILSVERTSGSTTVAEQLNSGNALTANASYLFDIVVESSQTINLQYSVAATALELSVDEIDMA